MKKIVGLVLSLLVCSSAFADTCSDKLVQGGKVSSAQAAAFCSIFQNSLLQDLVFTLSGKTISLQESTPASACMGSVTPNGTTAVTVTTTCAVSGSRVMISRNGTTLANIGTITVTASPNGSQFQFKSTNVADTDALSVVWMIVKESVG